MAKAKLNGLELEIYGVKEVDNFKPVLAPGRLQILAENIIALGWDFCRNLVAR